LAKKLPYPEAPTILLGRLAVHSEIEGKGYGSMLLIDALARCLKLSEEIGATGVVVDAIDARAVRWYVKFGFIQFPETPNRLFLPIGSIKALLPDDPLQR
jgi:GNAT superfamily N-acetyltransferase